ncbi:Arginase/deacetylase [Massarina eburnea CBS 473.64]|uniref:Arginase/deacetylase n=1 Tax=Massarina eburnea CBS 473.64 TaxID=1395130 RepID=A0A6A6RRB0_9PLEO|nr:Arginase/deacetylase [Massarina eburnea CBS 473.64]
MSSFAPSLPSPGLPKTSAPLIYQADGKPPLRAYDIAEEYFRKELALHEGMAGAVNAGTIAIIHDQCYGHRFARPKTNKATLNTIMERPERMLAGVKGIAAAYVRLGDRHVEGSHAPRPNQNPSRRIPFKIRKTSRAVDLTSPAVTNVHGTKWMEEFKSLCENAEQKLAATGKELARDPPTIPGQPDKTAFHPMDLYLSSESLNAIQGALGGVLDAVDAVFQGSDMEDGVSRAFVCIRPPGHHCSSEWPSGFCWINNVHVGIEHAMANYGLTHAAIVDFDLHHGDGSQEITWQRNKKVHALPKNTSKSKKTSIGYFSLHDINSFPCEDGDDDKVQAASLCIDNAHGQSIWNVHLETWSTVEEFWQIYEDKYLILLEKTRKFLKFHTNRLNKTANAPPPKAAIFISAGFDASEHETAGMQRHTVNVPTEFYARFTRDVVRLSEEMDTGVNGRIISVLEGGYSDRALTSGVLSHLSGLCDGQVWTDPAASGGMTSAMQKRMSGLSMYTDDMPLSPLPLEPTLVTYDPSWWHASRLAELENLVVPPPYVMPKKVRTGPGAHFSSPTQSFTAKVVDPSKVSRTVSGRYQSTSPSRAPTPPPQEVDWATATHALSKLLIPSDRQTHSCKPEELAEPKVKKEKPAPLLNSVHVDPSGRQLRGRKPATSYVDGNSDEETASTRASSRASRRQNLGTSALASPEPRPTHSRRISTLSNASSVATERSVSRASNIAPGRRSVTPSLGGNGVPTKKARGTTTAAARIPRNAPPMPSVPVQHARTAASKDKEKEKENNVDQLTSGLKRVTLKLGSEEEHNAREKARKEAENKSKTTRKPAPPRAPKTMTKAAVPKKTVGRPAKTSRPSSAIEPTTITSSDPPPSVPVMPEQTPSVSSPSTIVSSRRRSSTIEPLMGLVDMKITPEQLPKPSFVTAEEPVTMITSPPLPDTPPPPPPAIIPNFTSPSPPSGTTSLASPPVVQQGITASVAPSHPTAALSWGMAPYGSGRPMSAASKPGDLPVFSPNGLIPFASEGADGQSDAPMLSPQVKEEPRPDIWEVRDTSAH